MWGWYHLWVCGSFFSLTYWMKTHYGSEQSSSPLWKAPEERHVKLLVHGQVPTQQRIRLTNSAHSKVSFMGGWLHYVFIQHHENLLSPWSKQNSTSNVPEPCLLFCLWKTTLSELIPLINNIREWCVKTSNSC